MNENNTYENSNKATDKKVKNNIVHTDNYPKVLKDFQNRLISLMNAPDSNCRTEQQLAKLLKLPVRNVKPWVAGTRLPRAEVFPLLASIYKRPIDWFFGGEKPKPLTYADAFLALEGLGELVEIRRITDPFLQFMMEYYSEVTSQPYLPEQELASWRIQFLDDFDSPLLPLTLTSRSKAGLRIYSKISRYEGYLTCLRRMSYYSQHQHEIPDPFEIWAIHDSKRTDLLDSDGRPRDLDLYPPEWLEPCPCSDEDDAPEPESEQDYGWFIPHNTVDDKTEETIPEFTASTVSISSPPGTDTMTLVDKQPSNSTSISKEKDSPS